MKGYGLPRNTDVVAPDCADIAEYGLKSSVGHLQGPGGDTHSSFRNPEAKARARRRYARKARIDGKAACSMED